MTGTNNLMVTATMAQQIQNFLEETNLFEKKKKKEKEMARLCVQCAAGAIFVDDL